MIDFTPKNKRSLAESRKASSEKHKKKNTIAIERICASSSIKKDDILNLLKLIKSRIDTQNTYKFLCMLSTYQPSTIEAIYGELVGLRELFDVRGMKECLNLASRVMVNTGKKFNDSVDIDGVVDERKPYNASIDRQLTQELDYELEKLNDDIKDEDLEYDF